MRAVGIAIKCLHKGYRLSVTVWTGYLVAMDFLAPVVQRFKRVDSARPEIALLVDEIQVPTLLRSLSMAVITTVRV